MIASEVNSAFTSTHIRPEVRNILQHLVHLVCELLCLFSEHLSDVIEVSTHGTVAFDLIVVRMHDSSPGFIEIGARTFDPAYGRAEQADDVEIVVGFGSLSGEVMKIVVVEYVLSFVSTREEWDC